jgi:hypothetical protein
MASTYSSLKVELIGTGEQAGAWGATTNINLGTALEEAITGRATATFPSDANYTLPYIDSNSAQIFRNLVINATSSGNLSATRDLIIPAIEKQYIVENNTSGGQSIRVKTSGGTGVTIPNGRVANVFCNGTNTRFVDDYVDINGGSIDGTPIGAASASTGAFTTATISGGTINNTSIGATTPSTGAFTTVTATTPIAVTSGGLGLNVATQGDIIYSSASNTYVRLAKSTDATRYLSNTGTSNNPAWAQIDLTNGVVNTLPVNRGGTGAATLTTNNVLLGNGTSPLQAVAPGASGNVLTSNGTTWTSAAPPTSFITGMIIMWSGTIATIPSGWVLCNGSNGTPDLRDRFIVGASQDSGGQARTNVTGSLTQTGGTKDAIVVSHDHSFSATTSSAGTHQHTFGYTNGSSGFAGAGVPLSDFNTTGSSTVTTATAGAHTHTLSGTTGSAGSSGTNANLPPYYALAFIMKT